MCKWAWDVESSLRIQTYICYLRLSTMFFFQNSPFLLSFVLVAVDYITVAFSPFPTWYFHLKYSFVEILMMYGLAILSGTFENPFFMLHAEQTTTYCTWPFCFLHIYHPFSFQWVNGLFGLLTTINITTLQLMLKLTRCLSFEVSP